MAEIGKYKKDLLLRPVFLHFLAPRKRTITSRLNIGANINIRVLFTSIFILSRHSSGACSGNRLRPKQMSIEDLELVLSWLGWQANELWLYRFIGWPNPQLYAPTSRCHGQCHRPQQGVEAHRRDPFSLSDWEPGAVAEPFICGYVQARVGEVSLQLGLLTRC